MTGPLLCSARVDGRQALAFLYPPGVEPPRPTVRAKHLGRPVLLAPGEAALFKDLRTATDPAWAQSMVDHVRREVNAGRMSISRARDQLQGLGLL